jgi:putative NADPH-quinone reductase
MGKRIALVQGHPDPAGGHFGHALAAAYASAAAEAGHEVRTIEVARLDFGLLRNVAQWQAEPPPAPIVDAQQTLKWAEHLVILFPLWLGDMPAILKAFFEQALRPGFAIGNAEPGRMPKKLLKGRSAHIVVTMGMPAFFYRLYYRAHSVKNLKRNILQFVGFDPVRTSLVGMVEGKSKPRADWLATMQALGKAGR